MDTGALVSLVLSVIANISTFYFWLVKARKERPDLKAAAVAPFDAVLEGGRRAFLLRKFEQGTWKNDCGDLEGAYYYYLLIKGVAANHSALPNTVTGFRAWLKTREARAVGQWGFDQRAGVYVARGVLARTYLADAVAEIALLVAWVVFAVIGGGSER